MTLKTSLSDNNTAVMIQDTMIHDDTKIIMLSIKMINNDTTIERYEMYITVAKKSI